MQAACRPGWRGARPPRSAPPRSRRAHRAVRPGRLRTVHGRAHGRHFGPPRGGALDRPTHRLQQVALVERLDHQAVDVGQVRIAELVRMPADDHHRQVACGRAGAQLVEHFRAGALGQSQVQQDHVGPQQIEARISQEPAISAQLTLWSQQGSQVLRGNLLVIPLEDAILYVQPLYIQAQSSPLPELKRIIVASTGAVVMSDRLDTALTALGQGRSGEVLSTSPPPAAAPQAQANAASPAEAAGSTADLAAAARDHLRAAEAAAGRGDWATYGTEMASVHQLLDQLAAATGR